ncbi:hypothetical protein [Yinghuangia aomiensis]|uniref:hypothetical protein n=1 Tax=Yinghuangia aomiensis TaxID=676205 RepID=UPI0031ECBFBC
MHTSTVPGEHARESGHAMANLCSGAGYGLLDAPEDLRTTVERAIEIGYATALEHVRDGSFDEDLRQWRPELFEA